MAFETFAGCERNNSRWVVPTRVASYQEAFLPRWVVDRLSVRLELTLEILFYLCNIVSPHMGEGRSIKPGQKVHSSIAFGDESYHPKAILPQERCLYDLVGRGSRSSTEWVKGWEDLIEMDVFDLSLMLNVIAILKSGKGHESSVSRLKAMTSTGTYVFVLKQTLLTV